MMTYFVRRMFWLIPVLFFVALITFTLMHATPGGPWDRDLERRQVDAAHPGAAQRAVSAWISRSSSILKGGNPLDSQFFNYIWSAVRGNLGPSYRQRGRDVQDILFKPPEDKPFWDSHFGYSPAPGPDGAGFGRRYSASRWASSPRSSRTRSLTTSRCSSPPIGISVPSFVMAIFMIIILCRQAEADQDRAAETGAARAPGSCRRWSWVSAPLPTSPA